MPHTHYDNSKSMTVAASGTTSTSVEIEAYDVVGIIIPTIDSASVTLQVSNDNSNFFPVYDSTGTQQLTWAASTGARALSAESLRHLIGYRFIQVVLGAAQTTGARTIDVMLKDPRY